VDKNNARRLNMEVAVKNCNNIANGMIEIKEDRLNIKYAINGSGKSTVAMAIWHCIKDRYNGTQNIYNLTPFKNKGVDDGKPEVAGIEHLSSVEIFNEDYVNNFVFQPDELLKSSNDVFIRDETYEAGMKEIEEHVDTLQQLFYEDKDIDGLIKDLNELSESFGKPVKSGIHGSSAIAKAFSDGNKVQNIPEGLEDYKVFIQGENNTRWVKWQIDGKMYLETSNNCPYCVGDIQDKKEKIERISQEYDPKKIENLNKIISVFKRLDKYFSEDTKAKINDFVDCIDGYTNDQIEYLLEIKGQIDRLNQKFVNAQRLGFTSLKDVDKVIEGLQEHKIDIELFPHLDSQSTRDKVEGVNSQIEKLLDKAGDLQGCINIQKKHIESLVRDNKAEINDFLKNAGYHYTVDLIEDETGNYKLKLLDSELSSEVTNAKQCLSFGERNAFALLLFMYDAIKKKPDLIILDDPISSFDKNKKYAIVDMLFSKEKAFRGKTVLMLTHDFEPLIDMLQHHSDRFEMPNAAFIENNHGELVEREITREDIQAFIEVINSNVSSDIHIINQLVYLRRLFEVTANKSWGYELLSNLFHKRIEPLVFDEKGSRKMTDKNIQEGSNEIKEKIPDFDYDELLAIVTDKNKMIELYNESGNNYEKLHIYRILCDNEQHVASNIIRKFINEAFHLENDYIFQLNPSKYQLVPQYVIDECDMHINSIGY